MKTIGLLSDTHLNQPENNFLVLIQEAFRDCSIIIHAGDITDISILSSFNDKEVHAVSGNMCNYSTRANLTDNKVIEIEGYTIGITHGYGPKHSIIDRVYSQFPHADCIVYGHTHAAQKTWIGNTLVINPGAFQNDSFFDSPAAYGLLHLDDTGIKGSLHQLTLPR